MTLIWTLTLETARWTRSSFAPAWPRAALLFLGGCLQSSLYSLGPSSPKRSFLQAWEGFFRSTIFLLVLQASFVLRILEQITPKNASGMMKRTWESTVSTQLSVWLAGHVSIFAAWMMRNEQAPLGSSPSMQAPGAEWGNRKAGSRAAGGGCLSMESLLSRQLKR